MTILNQSPSGMSATSLAGLPFWSFHLCARELDHLTPLVGFIGNEFSEICRRAEQRSATEAREPYLHFGVRETGIYFLVQFVDDFWRTPTTSTCYRVGKRSACNRVRKRKARPPEQSQSGLYLAHSFRRLPRRTTGLRG